MSKSPSKKRQSTFAIAVVIAALLLAGLVLIEFAAVRIRDIEKQTQDIQTYQELYKKLGGFYTPQTTLLALANNAEIRVGGGFIGTVGIIRSDKGKVETSPLTGVYQIDSAKNCNTTQYTQPEYLKKLSPCPSLRDSANSIDFATNAEKMLYFYQLNNDQSVTNVVQITPMVLEGLLERLGPVYLKDYDITVSKDNFRDTVQLEVEAGKDKIDKKDPKTGVLGSLSNTLLARLFTQDIVKFQEYFPFLQDMIAQKQLVLYSKNKPTQQLIEKVGASGSVRSTDDNFFMLTEANNAANKNSPYLKNYVKMHQTVQPDGTSQVDVSIRTVHTSDYKLPYVDPNTNKSNYIVGEAENFVQIVLPEQAQLLKVAINGQSYSQSRDTSNKKYLIGYTRTLKPLNETTSSFSYKVPTKYYFGDSLVVNSFFQKQLGGWPYELDYTLTIADDSYELAATNSKTVDKSSVGKDSVRYTGTINQDTVLSFLYKKKR